MNSNEELNSYVCMTQDPTDSFLTVTAHARLHGACKWFVCSENSKKKKLLNLGYCHVSHVKILDFTIICLNQ